MKSWHNAEKVNLCKCKTCKCSHPCNIRAYSPIRVYLPFCKAEGNIISCSYPVYCVRLEDGSRLTVHASEFCVIGF